MKMIVLSRRRASTDDRWLLSMRLRERRHYRSEPCVENSMHKTRDIWLLGPPQCGKSSAIERMIDRAPEIWPRWPLIHWRATDTLSRWARQETFNEHLKNQISEGNTEEYNKKAISTDDKLDLLLAWAQAQKVVFILDDAHALSGRKVELAVRMAQRARLVVVGAISEQSLHPSLRTCLQRRAPQVISMTSEAPYDATLTLMWLLLLIVMAAGWWELAAALTSARALGHGPLATRQR